ncbi:bifunctional alpha/beta hydrolase/OsmC family protein [Lentiprolixibacter aurantiacus]|uniref:Bifunctional alpha/beta hydrolase/OsmC family protein n=1 Tax=Lentiprolixibacter aurantiacus TaxID=2993939 RepID=A0AAE3MM19_9FLAO|nr:bifunctional alpha/beta hydrolase/OsmC family protein [Lentiprolixibacter aurantiacus]MCX2720275.1 bifunctional alpha/beta hydrolase/OsmC family protein [Lentiprolixibacter aurantiacus]
MKRQKIFFKNVEGQELVGHLELPADQHPHNFALFAHCFTCNKNLSAVRNISKALTQKGFGVLRFDFTGLGESDGDFAETNFSGNVEDLIAAADYLKEQHQAPALLVGHSLGGAAAIFAGARLDSIQAIATIGAPSNPQHVTHLLQGNIEEIRQSGRAIVNLGGRPFTIKKQFLDDLEAHTLPKVARNLGKALLILHSPQDTTVGVKNAEEIYHAARHPKSFVSLDGADHLLSSSKDSHYTGRVIAEWASRYVGIPETPVLKSTHQVVASLDNDSGFTTDMKIGNHYFTADEPVDFGGNDFGPSPYEFVSAGLSACTVMTLQMYARRKGWDLQNVEVHTSYSKTHAEDCANCDSDRAKIDTFHREIRLSGELDEKQKQRLLEIADRCPVHRTLHSETQVITELLS